MKKIKSKKTQKNDNLIKEGSFSYKDFLSPSFINLSPPIFISIKP